MTERTDSICARNARNLGRVFKQREDVRVRDTGGCVECVDGDVADLARGHRHDAREAERVIGVEAESQIRDDIFDLSPFPKANAADEPVRDAAARQHILE